jgi:hypothetical protein
MYVTISADTIDIYFRINHRFRRIHIISIKIYRLTHPPVTRAADDRWRRQEGVRCLFGLQWTSLKLNLKSVFLVENKTLL